MVQYLVKCPVCEKMNLRKDSGQDSEYICSRCTFFFSMKNGKYSSGVTVNCPIEYGEMVDALKLDVYEID